jgi:hypothetical protein
MNFDLFEGCANVRKSFPLPKLRTQRHTCFLRTTQAWFSADVMDCKKLSEDRVTFEVYNEWSDMAKTDLFFRSRPPYTEGPHMIHILGSSYFDRMDSEQLNKITDDLHDLVLTFSFIEGSTPLRNYLFLTHRSHLLKRVRPDALACLVNRYYWLKKFSAHYDERNKKFTLLQMQLVSIVETIEREFPNFDWRIIQTIQHHIRKGDNRLERDE